MKPCDAHQVQIAVLEQELGRLRAENLAAFAEWMRLAIQVAALEATRATIAEMNRECLEQLARGKDVSEAYVEGMRAAQAEADRLLKLIGATE